MKTVKDLPGYGDELDDDSDIEDVDLTKRFASSIAIESKEMIAKKAANDVFSMVFKIGAVMGLPLSSAWLSSLPKAVGFFLKTWIAIFTIVKTVWICMLFAYNGLLWSSAGLRMCYFLHCVTGYGLTLNFLMKRHKIAESVNQIRYLSMQLQSDTASKKSRTILLLLLSIIIISAFLATIFNLFFYIAYESFSENMKERIPFDEDSEFYTPYKHFVLVSIFLCYNMSTMTLYIGLLLCFNAYNTVSDLFAFYAKRFKEGVVKNVFTTVTASEFTDMYRKIVACIDQMDEALNTCSFYIYMAVINCVFNVISLLLSKDALFFNNTATVFNGLIATSASYMFFQLTYSGDNLPTKSNRLKDEMIQMSDFVVIQRPKSASLMMFKILSENIKDNKPYATGFGLFNITKKFIPSVIGVILTYGVLLEQIGAT